MVAVAHRLCIAQKVVLLILLFPEIQIITPAKTDVLIIFFVFVHIFLHSRESELYRYILDGTSALAWELPFLGVWAICLSHKDGGIPLSALPKDTTSELAGLFSTNSHKCRAPSREAVDTIF